MSASAERQDAAVGPSRGPGRAPSCGARTRTGGACLGLAMVNGRCRMHGGASTGPRTAAGMPWMVAAKTTHGRFAASGAPTRVALRFAPHAEGADGADGRCDVVAGVFAGGDGAALGRSAGGVAAAEASVAGGVRGAACDGAGRWRGATARRRRWDGGRRRHGLGLGWLAGRRAAIAAATELKREICAARGSHAGRAQRPYTRIGGGDGGPAAGDAQRPYTRLGGGNGEPDAGDAQRPYTRLGGGDGGPDAGDAQRPYARLGGGDGGPDAGDAQRPYTRLGDGDGGPDAGVAQRPYTRLGGGNGEPDAGDAQRPYVRLGGGNGEPDAGHAQRPHTRLWRWGRRTRRGDAQRPYTRLGDGRWGGRWRAECRPMGLGSMRGLALSGTMLARMWEPRVAEVLAARFGPAVVKGWPGSAVAPRGVAGVPTRGCTQRPCSRPGSPQTDGAVPMGPVTCR